MYFVVTVVAGRTRSHMMSHNVIFEPKCVTAFVSLHEIQTKQGLTTYAASPMFYEVSVSADERIRTSTSVRTLEPESSASASSATPACVI